jgi:transcriptional regulator with XRE-family HTH domain
MKALRQNQEVLADRVGVDVLYIGGIERGQENPSLSVIVRVAAALGCTPVDLLKHSAR